MKRMLLSLAAVGAMFAATAVGAATKVDISPQISPEPMAMTATSSHVVAGVEVTAATPTTTAGLWTTVVTPEGAESTAAMATDKGGASPNDVGKIDLMTAANKDTRSDGSGDGAMKQLTAAGGGTPMLWLTVIQPGDLKMDRSDGWQAAQVPINAHVDPMAVAAWAPDDPNGVGNSGSLTVAASWQGAGGASDNRATMTKLLTG